MSRTDSNRRRFLQNTLAVGATPASPWAAGPVLAAESGRVPIGFQLPPPAMHPVSELLTAVRTRYQPDLGARPVVLPGSSSALAVQTVAGDDPGDGRRRDAAVAGEQRPLRRPAGTRARDVAGTRREKRLHRPRMIPGSSPSSIDPMHAIGGTATFQRPRSDRRTELSSRHPLTGRT